METEYLADLQRDPDLRRITDQVLPELQRLRPDQVETLVFFLKSLHSYYPASSNDVSNWSAFDDRLKQIRESTEQKKMERRAASLLFKAMLMGGVSIAMIAAAAAALLAGAAGPALGLAGLGVGAFVLAELKFGKPAIEAAKEQDRRYFLECLRAARGCNELDWCGLFAFNGEIRPGPQSDEDLEQARLRVADLTGQLRSALYNDEYRSYSHR